jgi:hypothetical protein
MMWRNPTNPSFKAYEYWSAIKKNIGGRSLSFDSKDAWYLVLDQGIGDCVPVLSLLDDFREQYGGPIVIIAPLVKRSLIALYRDKIDGAFFVPDHLVDFLPRFADFGLLERGQPFYTWWPARGEGRVEGYIEGETVLSVQQLFRIKLGLPDTARPKPPTIKSEYREAAQTRFAELNLEPGRTVVLFPYTGTAPRFGASFWSDLTSTLTQEGFQVTTNMSVSASRKRSRLVGDHEKGRPPMAEGSVAIDLSLEEMLGFVEIAGNVIAAASGICDLLAFSNSHKLFMFPCKRQDTPPFDLDLSICLGGASGGGSLRRCYGARDCEEHNVVLDEAFDRSLLDRWLLTPEERTRHDIEERLYKLDVERAKLLTDLDSMEACASSG